jgi:hypothetical protein
MIWNLRAVSVCNKTEISISYIFKSARSVSVGKLDKYFSSYECYQLWSCDTYS